MHRKIYKGHMPKYIMKKGNEIKSRDKVIKTYYICCPICDEEIKGNSASHVEFNLKLHIEKHNQLKKETKNASTRNSR